MLGTSKNGKIIYQHLSKKYLQNAYEVARKTLFSRNLYKVIGVPQDNEALEELTQILEATAKDGLSIIAVDKSTDEVVRTLFNKIRVKSQPFYGNIRRNFKNEKSRLMTEFTISTENMIDIFGTYRVDCIMKMVGLGILPQYRNQEIGTHLLVHGLGLAQELYSGVNVKSSLDGEELTLGPTPEGVTGITTSFVSQKMLIGLGFEVVATRSNKLVEIGNRIIENNMTDTDSIGVVYKKLKKKLKSD